MVNRNRGFTLLEVLVALLVFGLFTRDGLFVLLGYLCVAITLIAGALLVLDRAGSFERAVSPLGRDFSMLLFNAGWSLAFFGMNEVALALGILVALWLLIVAMMQDFWRYSHLAALLQIPYLVWISFAGYLNAYILFTN